MYTTIIHPLRKSLNISCNEYCVLDSVYHLSNNNRHPGWCYSSRQHLAEELDLSKQTIITIIDNLISKGLVIRDDETKFLKPGETYRESIQQKSDWILGKNNGQKFMSGRFTDGKESLPDRSRNFTESGKETLPYNNIYNNNYNKREREENFFIKNIDNQVIKDYLLMREKKGLDCSGEILDLLSEELKNHSKGNFEKSIEKIKTATIQEWKGLSGNKKSFNTSEYKSVPGVQTNNKGIDLGAYRDKIRNSENNI